MTKKIIVEGCSSCPYLDSTDTWDWVCLKMLGMMLLDGDVKDPYYIHDDCPLEEHEKYGVVLTDKGTVDVYVDGNL